MSLKPPVGAGRPGDISATGSHKPASSFLKSDGGSMRSGMIGGGGGGAGGKTAQQSNFSKMVSGRAGQSTRKGDGRSSGSGRRSRKKKKDDSARVIVDGKDVTPLPLMSAPGAMGFHPSAAMFSVGGQSTAEMSSALDSTTEHGFGGSLAHGGGSAASGDSEHQHLHMGGGGDDRDWATNFARAGMQFEYALDAAPTGPVKAKEWSDRELREKHTIKIEETETITLFHLPGLKIWTEDETESAQALKANANYLACLEKHKEKDKYSARAQQTYNPTSREKEVQVAPPSVKSVGCDVSTWDIFDIGTKLESQVSSVGPGGYVPRIQHESDLLARTAANATSGAGATGGALVSRAEEEEEELAATRAAGGDGHRGATTGASNTPSVQSAQHSFHGNATAGQSFRGGAAGGKSNAADRSWHQNINLASSTSQSGHQSSSHAGGSLANGGASQSGMGKSTAHGPAGAHGQGGGAGARDIGPKVIPLDKLLSKTAITRALRGLEQAVLQNTLHEAQMLYRNHPEAAEEAWAAQREASGPKYEWMKKQGGGGPGTASGSGDQALEQGSSLLPPLNSLSSAQQQHQSALESSAAAAASMANSSPAGVAASMIPLWSFSCPLTSGLNVSCMSWNKQNLDLLAAGYGSLEFGHSSRDRSGHSLNGIRVPTLPKDGVNTASPGATPAGGGLILFWSLKNPSFPQKIFYTKSSVTSLDFSDEHPHLLAAGLYDGSVAIFDIRDAHSKPALESSHSSGKHSEPVWGVKFVAKELHKRSQQLTSISTDGSVKQWSMKKGLVPHELMQLKRMTNRAQLQGTTMEGLSREASGMCFDFPINDGTQYFAGTEDGLIHKCSVSYNEQTLENFYGHTGPVYKVRCSPFLPDAFLSCSADWSAMLWSQKVTSKPVLKFASGGHDYITDIVWSANQACVFGLVSREGRVEIWDLDVSPLDPVIKYQIPIEVPVEANGASAAANGGAASPTGTNGMSDAAASALASAAAAGGHAAAGASAHAHPLVRKRFLSCMAFSSNAPVVLVGTSDGSIELFRLEGTALTSTPPEHVAPGESAAYGQELNAATVMQVPRDRERDAHAAGHDGSGSAQALLHEEQARLALEVHQQSLVKFRAEAKKLEGIMEQHNESKNKLQAALTSGADAANGTATNAGAGTAK